MVRFDWTDFDGIRKGIRLPIRGGEPAHLMFARKHLRCRCARRLKQEEVYRRAYETVGEARKGIADYLRYFNEERPHQGLGNRTPDDVFYQRKLLVKAS